MRWGMCRSGGGRLMASSVSKDSGNHRDEPRYSPQPPRTGRDLFNIALGYWNRVLGLRKLIRELGPVAVEKDRQRQQELSDQVSALTAQIEAAVASELNIDYIDTKDDQEARKQELLSKVLGDNFDFLLFELFEAGPTNTLWLNASTLVVLVGAFEELVADLLHVYFSRYPQALRIEDDVLSWQELVRMSSIQEAIDHVVSKRVDMIMRGGIEQWLQVFARHNIDLRVISPDWDSFFEVFQRRHVIVHNGGRANTHYLSKVSQEWISKQSSQISSGDVLLPTTEYLENAIDLFISTGFILCDMVWAKLDQDSTLRTFLFERATYRLLRSSEWHAASLIYESMLKHSNLDDITRLVFQLNLWLCRKRMGQLDLVKEEMDKFNPKVVNPLYALGFFSLCERSDEFFECLDQLINTRQIESRGLEEWPILDEMRSDPRFRRALRRVKLAERKLNR